MGNSLCCVEQRKKDQEKEQNQEIEGEEAQVESQTKKKYQKKRKISNLLIDMNNFYKFREGDFRKMYLIIDEIKLIDFVGEFQNDANEMQEIGAFYREVVYKENGNKFTMQAFDINSSALDQDNHFKWFKVLKHHGIARMEKFYQTDQFFIHILEHFEGHTLKQFMNR